MSSVLVKGMSMPKECHGCRFFYFNGTSCTEPKYYLDARCKLVESGQDWYGKDSRGGWVGESIEHIPGWSGSYPHKHCIADGTLAKQCPLVEVKTPHGRLFDETEVKKCLQELTDCEDKWSAIALLEWAIEKRWCIEAEDET